MPRILLAAVVSLLSFSWLAVLTPDAQAMSSTKISKNVCETTGGGRFVAIPDAVPHQAGDRIDVRLVNDLLWLAKRYPIYITDGYATSGHSEYGEHPIGLAADIVPSGGSWKGIDELARFAEPSQNNPRAPWRWVGYDGDANHGRGNHLHLSWDHGESRPGKPARVVYTRICPNPEVEYAEKLLDRDGLKPLAVDCNESGRGFRCEYQAARLIKPGEGAIWRTKSCTGEIKIAKRMRSAKSRIVSRDCERDTAGEVGAGQLADELVRRGYGAPLESACWGWKGAKRCQWRVQAEEWEICRGSAKLEIGRPAERFEIKQRSCRYV